MKTCNLCGIQKPLSKFYKHKRYSDGYRSQCIDCLNVKRLENRDSILESKRNSYLRNKDRISKRRKEKYPELRELLSKYKREYYKDNREYLIEKAKRWASHNKAKVNASQQKRRIKKKSALIKSLTRDDYYEMESIYEVARLMTELFDETFHVDHIVPLQHKLVCGLHVPWNLQIITAKENLSKSNKFEI